MTPGEVWDLAVVLKASIQAYFGAQSVGLPARKYITTGTVAWDCEQFVVAVPRIFYGLPAAESPGPVRQSAMRSVEFSINLIQCVPTVDDRGKAPTADELNGAARDLLESGWTLFLAVLDFTQTCDDVSLGSLDAGGPSGGFGGWSQTVRVQI